MRDRSTAGASHHDERVEIGERDTNMARGAKPERGVEQRVGRVLRATAVNQAARCRRWDSRLTPTRRASVTRRSRANTSPTAPTVESASRSASLRWSTPYHTSTYVNFLMDEGPARIRQAYGEAKYNRLKTLKRTSYPENFFRLNQNIPPA